MTDVRSVEAPILAIELSQRRGGVAIVDPSRRVHSVEVAGGRRDRDDLAPAVAAVLADAGLDASALAAVAVDVGPGGFTGLRVSIALAQSMAEVVGASVVAVPGALVAAGGTPGLEGVVGDLLVLSAAKAGTAWGTVLGRARASDPWRVVGSPGIMASPPDRPLAAVLADEHLDDAFRAAIPDGTPVLEPRFEATALAEVALEGGPDLEIHRDPARLVPTYPREPEAVRVWRERHPDNLADPASTDRR